MDQTVEHVQVAHPSGLIEVPADVIMRFVTPMWGFEQHPGFALLPAARQGLWWFISPGDNPATFVLADPFVALEGYSIDLTDQERAELDLQDEGDALALVMLTMPATPSQPVTGNFRAPLVFNLAERRVKQVVVVEEEYGLAQPVDLSLYALKAGDAEGNSD